MLVMTHRSSLDRDEYNMLPPRPQSLVLFGDLVLWSNQSSTALTTMIKFLIVFSVVKDFIVTPTHCSLFEETEINFDLTTSMYSV